MIKIIVADEHDTYRETLICLLQMKGFDIVGVSNGIDLSHILDPLNIPDIAILSHKITRLENIELIRWFRNNYSTVKVVVNSLYTPKLPIQEFKAIGISAVNSKSHADEKELIELLKKVYEGNILDY